MPRFHSPRVQHLIAAGVLLMSTLCCFHRLVLLPSGLLVGPQNGGQNDLTASILPSRAFVRRELLTSGEVPMWQPRELTGIPWLGNPQSAMFYPPNWLYLLTDQPWLAGWLMAAHLWLGGFGVYFYCRVLGLNWASGVVAGCGYLGAPFLIANVCEGHYNPLCIAAWLPWALVCFERLRSGQRGGVLLMSLVLALCFFCGHVQEVFYAVLILSCWLVADCVCPRKEEEPSPGTLLGRWCLTGLATLGLTAVELIPIYVYTKHAVRSSGLDIEASARFSLNETSLWQLLDPLIAGGPEQITASGPLYWETVCHFGLAITLLAILGILGAWNRKGVKRIAITLGLCVLFGLGTTTPFFSLLFHYVPGISLFRGSSRILMHLSLFVSILAGFGLQSLFAEESEPSPGERPAIASWLMAMAAAVILVIGVWNPAGWALQPPQSDSPQNLNPWTIGLGAGGFLAVWLLMAIGRGHWAKLAAALAVVIVTAEHSWHANRVLRVVPAERFRRSSEIVEFLKTHAGDSRVLASQDLLSDGEAWRQGISKVHGYEPVPPVRAVILIDAITRHRDPQDELIGLQATYPILYRQNVLNLLGARYAVIPAEGPKLPESWERVASGEVPPVVSLVVDTPRLRYEIWRNPNALPRAFVLGDTQLIRAEIPHGQQLAHSDPQKFVLVSQDVLPKGSRQPYRKARIVASSPNQVILEAELDSPGYLVLSDLMAPGWRAKVNESPALVLPVNVSFRGVALPAGRHQITLTYTPPGLWFGALVGAATLLSLLLAAASANRETTPE